MFCKNCGEQMEDNSSSCPKCGQLVDAQSTSSSDYQQPESQQQQYQQPQYQQQQYQQPQYQQPAYQQPIIQQNFMRDETVSVGDWIGTFFVSIIPLVGFILILVWAFGSDTKKSKSNYAKAILILGLIVAVLYGVLFLIFGAAIFGSNMYY